jgi:hypothetical protein
MFRRIADRDGGRRGKSVAETARLIVCRSAVVAGPVENMKIQI